jgi:hypothetical protein
MIIQDLNGREFPSLTKVRVRTAELNPQDLRQNSPKSIVLHSTYSYPRFDELQRFHLSRGFSGVGYHFFIASNNDVFQARPTEIEGAHCIGSNTSSIGLGLYSDNGRLSRRNLRLATGLIEDIRNSYGNLPLVSHTQAQINYLNELISLRGFKRKFYSGADIFEPNRFLAVKKEIEEFMHQTQGLDEIKAMLKTLKNCPGVLFGDFL